VIRYSSAVLAALPLAGAEWEAMQAAADAQERPNPYRTDPVGWIRDVLGEHVWSKQEQIATALRDHRKVAVPSCHEAGKSWLAARAVAWWLTVWPPGEAFAVTTAPTAPQVRAILWREINRAHRKGRLPGRTNQTEWWINDEIVAFGRKPADYDPAAFQGIHARRVLVVIDEACGVPETIWIAGASLTANEHSRMFAIGNPDDPGGYFAKVCGPDSGWHVVPIDAFETPNFTGEPIPGDLRDLLVSPIYEQEMRAEFGEDGATYLSKVRGRFPSDQPDGVVPLSWVRQCQNQDREYAPDQLLPVELGVDVGAGGDETVIRERRGVLAGRTWRYKTPDSTQATGYVRQAIAETGATCVKVDVVGIGWGVVGALKEQGARGEHAAQIVGVNVGTASREPNRFPKLRDQLWWEIGRELSRQKAWDLSSVDETTVAQLIAPTWKPDSSGRHQIEKKADTKARLKRSPDDADALLLAWYAAPAPAASIMIDPGPGTYRAPRRSMLTSGFGRRRSLI
jgi:hypothetical protein